MCQKWQQKYTVSKRCQKCSPTLSIRICIFSRKNEETMVVHADYFLSSVYKLFMRTIFLSSVYKLFMRTIFFQSCIIKCVES